MSLFNNELEITNNQPSAILSGVYSNTGFDMVGILSRLINRQTSILF
jgi:hypothetical protein